MKLIYLTLTLPLITSCSYSDKSGLSDILVAGGAYGIAQQVQDDSKVSAAAGAAAFLLNKKNRQSLENDRDASVEKAKLEGKQIVMKEVFNDLYAQQKGNSDNAQGYHEVDVPFNSYTTSDGIVLKPHTRTILTR